MKTPVRIAITGAAGNIGYALAFRVAAGDMLGLDQPVILHLIEIPAALDTLEGVCMELRDCAFPLLGGIVKTADIQEGFDKVDYVAVRDADSLAPIGDPRRATCRESPTLRSTWMMRLAASSSPSKSGGCASQPSVSPPCLRDWRRGATRRSCAVL